MTSDNITYGAGSIPIDVRNMNSDRNTIGTQLNACKSCPCCDKYEYAPVTSSANMLPDNETSSNTLRPTLSISCDAVKVPTTCSDANTMDETCGSIDDPVPLNIVSA